MHPPRSRSTPSPAATEIGPKNRFVGPIPAEMGKILGSPGDLGVKRASDCARERALCG